MSSANPNGSVNNTPIGTGTNNAVVPGVSPDAPDNQPQIANLQPETVELTSAEDRAREEQTRQAIIVASIVGIISLIILIAFIIFLASDPARTALIRDIVIVLASIGMLLMTIAIGILMVILIYRVQELIGFLRGELIPVISKIGNSVNQVTGTANLVSDSVAKPTIKVASMMAGLQQMAKTANSKVRGGR